MKNQKPKPPSKRNSNNSNKQDLNNSNINRRNLNNNRALICLIYWAKAAVLNQNRVLKISLQLQHQCLISQLSHLQVTSSHPSLLLNHSSIMHHPNSHPNSHLNNKTPSVVSHLEHLLSQYSNNLYNSHFNLPHQMIRSRNSIK